MRTFLSLTLLPLLWVSCQSTPKAENSKYDYSVKMGEAFHIDLKSNPSTGYTWQWVKNEKASIVELTVKSYKSAAKSGVVGAGGISIFQFKAIRKGRETIHLEYVRPWEKGAKPAQVATFEIEVK